MQQGAFVTDGEREKEASAASQSRRGYSLLPTRDLKSEQTKSGRPKYCRGPGEDQDGPGIGVCVVLANEGLKRGSGLRP